MRSPVGKFATALMSGEKSVLPGSLKLDSSAGLSMGHIVADISKEAGKRRWNYADNVKYLESS
jgi:hypothetical protein